MASAFVVKSYSWTANRGPSNSNNLDCVMPKPLTACIWWSPLPCFSALSRGSRSRLLDCVVRSISIGNENSVFSKSASMDSRAWSPRAEACCHPCLCLTGTQNPVLLLESLKSAHTRQSCLNASASSSVPATSYICVS